MSACAKSGWLVALVVTLCGCGGGSESSPDTSVLPETPSVSEEERLTEVYTEFVDADGMLLVELPLASVESFFQLAAMADERVRQAGSLSDESQCQGNSAGEGQGLLQITASDSPLTSASLIRVYTEDCYDPFLQAVTNGSYEIQLSALDDDSWQYQLLLNDLTVGNVDSLIELEGSLNVTATHRDTRVESQIQSTADDFELRFVDNSDVISEIFSALNITRTFDYIAAQRTISGNFTEASGVLGETLSVVFSQPFTGSINQYPTAGELLIEAQSIAGRIEVDRSGTGIYLAPVSFANNGDYFAPDAFTFNFDDVLDGTLFLPPEAVFSASGVRVYDDDGAVLSLLDSSGIPQPDDDGIYSLSAGDELVLRFSQPVSFNNDGQQPTLTRLGGEREEVSLSFSVEGGIVRITLPANLKPASLYQLKFVLSAGESTMQMVYDFAAPKNISLEVTSPLFGFAGEPFALTTEVLGSVDILGAVEWEQVSGPALANLTNQQTQTITLPDIDADYETAVLLAKVSDENGNTSQQTFHFVIVDPTLNRNLVFLPYAYPEPLVLSGDINHSISRSKSEFYQIGVDLFHYYAIANLSTFAVSAGAYSTDDEGSGLFQLETSSGLINDEACEVSELSFLRPGVTARLHAADVAVENGGITAGNFVVNRYCGADDTFHAYFGVLLRENLFTVNGAGFLYPDSSFPLSVKNVPNEALSIAVMPAEAVTVASDLSDISASNIAANGTAEVIFTRDENMENRSETLQVDLIADLTDAVHIYFDSLGWTNGTDTGLQVYQYNKSLVVAPEDIRLHISEGGGFLNVEVDKGLDDLLANIGLSLNTISSFPVGEKVVIDSDVDSDQSVDVSFNYILCEKTTSSFTLHELEIDADNNITRLAVDGYNECMMTNENDNAQPSYARMSVRFNSTVPVNPVSEL